jgi:uncharacterized membrane protein YkgB
MKRKKKINLSFGEKCVRLSKGTYGCLHKHPDHVGTWHEVVLAILLLLGMYLLQNYTSALLAPLVSNNPLRDPAVILQPFVLIMVALLLVQKIWKSCILGFVLAMTITLVTLMFLVILVAMATIDTTNLLDYFTIMLLPVAIFAIAVAMGKKYQGGLCH